MRKKVFLFALLVAAMAMPIVATAQDKPCDPVTYLPWWEDFQAYPHNTQPPTVPTCWHFQGTNEPSIGQYNVHSGYYTCILDLYSTGVTWAALLNPFDTTLDINHMQVTFSAGKSSSSDAHNSDLIVGITTNPLNPSDANFTPLDTLLMIPHTSGDTMPRFTVDFARYNDTGRYFCFKTQPIMSSGVNFLAIDSLVFDFNDHCMVPQRLRVYNVTDMSACFSWNQYHSGHADLQFKAVDDTGWTTVPVLGRWKCASNMLAPSTSYMARVRQDCSLSYNGYSDWSDTVYFTTDTVHCRMPEDLTVTDIANTSATFGWTNRGTAGVWEVHVFNSSYNRTFTANTNPYTVTGLSHGTNYRVTVRSMCDASNTSDWTDTIMITTSSCFAVNNVTAVPSVNEAVISWVDQTNENQEWEIIWGLPGFTESNMTGSTITSGMPTFTIEGLDANTPYVAKVRALCEGGRYSEYTSVAFNTLPESGEGIENAEGMRVSIYPNPATTATTISVRGAEGRINVAVIGMDGRMVQQFEKECPTDCDMVVDVEGLAKGTYLVRLTGEGFSTTRKFNVQ